MCSIGVLPGPWPYLSFLLLMVEALHDLTYIYICIYNIVQQFLGLVDIHIYIYEVMSRMSIINRRFSPSDSPA